MNATGGRIVVKVGTSTLTDVEGCSIDRAYLDSLASQLQRLRASGYRPVLVTSGAILAGVETLGLAQRPTDMSELQATASVGQAALIANWATALAFHGMTIGQVLLTRHDTSHRQQYLLACQTLERLMAMDVVPVVNENDTTAVDEIRFGDNDTLAALVGIMVRAELVVLLSDIEGGTEHGSGGMATKIEAARVLMKAGIPLVVCDGRRPDVVIDAAAGKPVGTYFAPRDATVGGRKLWIAYGRKPAGTITVDDGARTALTERGGSLLPAGVVAVSGAFTAGDAVDLAGPDGGVFARGLAGMAAPDVEAVKGTTSASIAEDHPSLAGTEVVHRDRLVIL